MRLTTAIFILISPLSVCVHSYNLQNNPGSFPVDNPAQRHLHSQMQQQQSEQLKLQQDMQQTRQRQA